NRKVSEDVLSGRRQREVVRRGDHQIGLPELPALRHRGKRRTRGRITLGRAALNPLPNQLDLIVAQTALVIEVAVAWLGEPWRHRAAGNRLEYLASLRANRGVLEHAEGGARKANWIRRTRRVIDRPMTRGAVLIENRRDVVRERRRRLPRAAGQNHRAYANP